MKIQDFQDNVTCGGFDNIFANIYKPQDIESQKSRYMSAVEKFTALYPNRNDIHVYSAPGRTEIGGNHTDHQHGCVIAGAVDLDVIGVAAFHDENIIRIKSEGYDEFAVSLDDLDVHIGEKGSSEIVRGIAARFKDLGVEISGFDMYTTSNVLAGSGISSSAAYQNKHKNKSDKIYNKQDVMPSAYHFSYIYEEKLSPKAMGFFIYFALFVFSVIKLDIIGKTGVKARII